jgi:hypothetical protein
MQRFCNPLPLLHAEASAHNGHNGIRGGRIQHPLSPFEVGLVILYIVFFDNLFKDPQLYKKFFKHPFPAPSAAPPFQPSLHATSTFGRGEKDIYDICGTPVYPSTISKISAISKIALYQRVVSIKNCSITTMTRQGP